MKNEPKFDLKTESDKLLGKIFPKVLEQEFFDRLASKLEELFPKTNIDNPEVLSKGNRTTALVFNAYANLIFREILEKVISEREELKAEIGNLIASKERCYQELAEKLETFLTK